MYSQKPPTRQAPGIFDYMWLFSTRRLAYTIFFGTPLAIALLSVLFHALFMETFIFIEALTYFIEIFGIFFLINVLGTFLTVFLYRKKAPVIAAPPKGWGFQMNTFFCAVIGGSFLIGQILTIFLGNITFQEVFFILGTILSYIFAFTVYFSFTTVEKPGYLILALVQPVAAIILYSIWTAQISFIFFIRAILFFCSCAFIFAFPYARGLFHVSNVYREATGIGGYGFIRAFVLSMLTDGNDEKIEDFFDRIGVRSNIKLQYLCIRTQDTKRLKGILFMPHIHFGPFKTCGSSDLPEHIYRAFEQVPGATVYHTTNNHAQNLTSQQEVERVLEKVEKDIKSVQNDEKIQWNRDVVDFSRKISNSAKLIGMVVDNVPLIFLTRHPLPSDDIVQEIGEDIRTITEKEGFKEILIVDSHNSIVGDEILICRNTIEANDLINVSQKYVINNKSENSETDEMLYGVAKDPLDDFSEKDGIGYGGLVVHLFKNVNTEQKTALIHFDGNNAYVDIRSYILNLLQNRGIEKCEVTTSDSHTVARQFSSRGYSPIGDKIKLEYILEKIDALVNESEKNLEPVEFCYYDSTVEAKVWGDPKYFETIMNTLQECIRVSQKLMTFSFIIPTFFSVILLLFYYNIQITEFI